MKKLLILALSVIFFSPLVTLADDTVSWSSNTGVNLCANGVQWLCAIRIASPQVTVQYHASSLNTTTGQILTQNTPINVAQGDVLVFTYTPQQYYDVSWFGTGWSFDSPYGEWAPGAASSGVSCNDKDYVTTTWWWGFIPVNQYDRLIMNPPSHSFSSSNNLSCSLSGNSYVCTATKSGPAWATLTYDGTYGQFYGGFINPYWYGVCESDNQPMQQYAGGFQDNWDMETWWVAPPRSGYTVSVPAQSISYSMQVKSKTPTCSITLDSTSIPYGSTTWLHWRSTNANGVYIAALGGWQGQSGDVQVGTPGTYSGYASGQGGQTDCAPNGGTLAVQSPPPVTVHIRADNSSIMLGQSTSIRADFTAGSGDTLTGDNIDSPVGTGLGGSTGPDAQKTALFTPTSMGTFTFYARAVSSYYSNWTTYAQTNVTVSSPPPTCRISVSPSTIVRGNSATLAWTSSYATDGIVSPTPGAVGPQSSTAVSPGQTTTYTGTFTGAAGSVSCTPATLTVTCAPVYSCSGAAGSDGQQHTISYTNSSCEITNTDCAAPSYCSAGKSTCQWPPPVFVPFTSHTGHLQVAPALVRAGQTVQLYWRVDNVTSCIVTGSNGDTWSAAYSGPNGVPTAKIRTSTTYTLDCTPFAGSGATFTKENVTVKVAPDYQEI